MKERESVMEGRENYKQKKRITEELQEKVEKMFQRELERKVFYKKY